MHTAVALFDSCLEKEEFWPGQYQAVAVICLFIASKTEELEYYVPRAKHFISVSKMPAVAFRRMEL